jgi:glycosyltransferase involved in cell wall biosynthesis
VKSIDIVAPARNEEQCLRAFYEQVRAALDPLPYSWRIIFIDDGSTDATLAVCQELAQADDRVRYIHLSRNFGHQAALTAGLDVANADVVITMDTDLEHPPETLPVFVKAWEVGAEVVHGIRGAAPHLPLGKKIASRGFYKILSRLANVPIIPDSPDFRLLDRRAVLAVRSVREQARFLRGIYSWIGFRQQWVSYEQGKRLGGSAKYTPRRMLRFGVSGLVSFSRKPLRIAAYMGFAVSGAAFLYGAYAIVQKLVLHRALPGWSSLAVLISMLSGIQLLTLGVIGEYLGQVLEEVKDRPLYIVADSNLTDCVASPRR